MFNKKGRKKMSVSKPSELSAISGKIKNDSHAIIYLQEKRSKYFKIKVASALKGVWRILKSIALFLSSPIRYPINRVLFRNKQVSSSKLTNSPSDQFSSQVGLGNLNVQDPSSMQLSPRQIFLNVFQNNENYKRYIPFLVEFLPLDCIIQTNIINESTIEVIFDREKFEDVIGDVSINAITRYDNGAGENEYLYRPQEKKDFSATMSFLEKLKIKIDKKKLEISDIKINLTKDSINKIQELLDNGINQLEKEVEGKLESKKRVLLIALRGIKKILKPYLLKGEFVLQFDLTPTKCVKCFYLQFIKFLLTDIIKKYVLIRKISFDRCPLTDEEAGKFNNEDKILDTEKKIKDEERVLKVTWRGKEVKKKYLFCLQSNLKLPLNRK